MDDKLPKEYVAELLKQLEELKRKKAHKERKLQKLKGRSVKDLRKERTAKTSNVSIEKEQDEVNVSETSLKKLEENVPEKNVCERKSSSSFNDSYFEKASDDHFNNDKKVLVNEKCHSLNFENVPEKNVGKRKSSDSLNDSFFEKVSDNHINNDKKVLVNEKCHSLNFENVPEKNICKRKSSDSLTDSFFEKVSDNHVNNDKKILVNEKCHSLNFENFNLNKDIENHSDVDIQKCIAASDENYIKNHKIDKVTVDCLKKSNYLNNFTEHSSCKSPVNVVFVEPTVNKQETNSKNVKECNLSIINKKLSCDVEKSPGEFQNTKSESTERNLSIINDAIVCSVGKTSSDVEKANIEESVICNIQIPSDIKEKEQINMPNDLALDCALDVAKNFTKHDSSENKLSNDSNKSLSSGKGKSSDILDDSLNSNMSFFMSADLFANEDNDKKYLNKGNNDNELCASINQSSPRIEKNPKTIHPKLSCFDRPHLSLNGHRQNNLDVFNFPKFSTPTEGNTQIEKDDDMPDLIEKSQEIIDITKRNHFLNKAFKNNLPSTSKFDSPFALEKRLSSVLDAHYESPKKISSKAKIFSVNDNLDYFCKDNNYNGNAYKKRKLFTEFGYVVSSEFEPENHKLISNIDSDEKSDIALGKSFQASVDEYDKEMKYIAFDNVSAFNSDSNSINSLKNIAIPPAALVKNSCDDIPSQVSKTVDGLVNKICNDVPGCKLVIEESVNKNEDKCAEMDEELRMDPGILVIPETEGLGLYFSKDTEEFLETSTLSESMSNFPVKENFLNLSSQSKLESPIVKNIVAAVKSSTSFQSIHQADNIEFDVKVDLEKTPKNVINDAAATFDNSLCLDTSFLEDDTQDLGNFKQVPYMDDVNADERIMTSEIKTDNESNLKFKCSLSSSVNEPVVDVEIILFKDVKYVILQHKTYLCVWRQERNKQWIKIFNHQIEDMLSLVKISVSMDDNNLVIIMLLRNEEQYCLQFLIFERDARVIKLMENTHWLEERCSEDSILLCGLSGLMFATAQNREKPEVSVHAFISLKENPRLMTAVLGSTDTPLCSLCKIDKLPNALMGIGGSMLYVWHILEARLVTAVSLHPHDYIPIKECFWATVENGLIYFLTTCEEDKNHHICQLLAANLATGFCQSAMAFSTLPSTNTVKRIVKAAYQEPFLVVAHTEGAFIWSVTEEFCCAALPSESNISSIAISRDIDNWGLLAVGSKNGLVNCYSLH